MKLSKLAACIIISGAFLSSNVYAYGQKDLSTWESRSPINFFGNNADIDWKYVDNLSESEKSFSERLKRINLDENGDLKVSLHGYGVLNFENRQNKDFDPDKANDNEYKGGYYFATDFSYKDKYRLFGEIRTNSSNFDTGPWNPTLDAGTDIHQLFVEMNDINIAGGSLDARIGRQELTLDMWQLYNQLPLAVRSRFDAVKLDYKRGMHNFTAYYGEEIHPYKECMFCDYVGNWDDERISGNNSTGLIYSTFTPAGLFKASFANHQIEENLFIHTDHGAVDIYTVGASLYKFARTGLGYMLDARYQFGDTAGQDVSAYMAFADVNYKIQKDWGYKFGGIGYVGSGDDPNDDKLTGYNLAWGSDLLGFAADAAYSNAINLGTYLQTEYMPKQTVNLAFMSTWRINTDDALYGISLGPIYGADSDEKFAYSQVALVFNNQITPNVITNLELSYAMDSDYIKDVVGENSENTKRIKFNIRYLF